MDWSSDTVIPNHFSSYAIGLVTMPDGRIMCVHRGGNSDTRLWYAIFSNGKWGEDKMFPSHHSANGASLAIYRGAVHCVHRGGLLDDWVYLTVYDAANDSWSNDVKLAGSRSSRNPGLAAYKTPGGVDVLYCVFKGCDPDNRLWYTSYDGNGWTNGRLISDDGHRTDSDPTLVVYGGTLYCLHQGRAYDENIYYTKFDGNTWSADTSLPDHKAGGKLTIRGSIGATSDARYLYIVHSSSLAGDKSLWYSRFNGSTWSTDEKLQPGAHNGCFSALTISKGDLICIHDGYDDVSLWETYATVPAVERVPAALAV